MTKPITYKGMIFTLELLDRTEEVAYLSILGSDSTLQIDLTDLFSDALTHATTYDEEYKEWDMDIRDEYVSQNLESFIADNISKGLVITE